MSSSESTQEPVSTVGQIRRMNKPLEKNHKTLSKGRGKESEFRSKKQKNELHILKMSQEWDLRRQKRRLDRQKWVEERRNQKLPIWQRVGNLRVQANEEILDEAGNELVNKKQKFENSNKAEQSSISHNDNMRENSLESRENGMGNTLRVQTLRFTEGTTSAKCLDEKQIKEPEIKFIKIEQTTRTMAQPLLFNMNTAKTAKTTEQITEHSSIKALNCNSKSPDSQLKEIVHECKTSLEKVRMKTTKEASTNDEPEGAYKDRKRKFEAISVDTGFKEMPTLMRVDKPTTLENIGRQNGPVTICSSANDSVIVKPIARTSEQPVKGEAMPQIKQCYSLLERREETPNVNFFAIKTSPNNPASVSFPVPPPATTTTAASEVKSPAVGADTKCIVYMSKTPASVAVSPGAPSHSRPSYLVPVYKASTRDTAYTFLPAGTAQQQPPRVGEKSGLEGRLHDYKTDCGVAGCTSTPHYAVHSYPFPRSTAGLKEAHTGCVFSTGKVLPHSPTTPLLYRDPIIPTATVHSCHEPVHSNVIPGPSPSSDSPRPNIDPTWMECKNHIAKIQHESNQAHKTNVVNSAGSLPPEGILTVVAAPLTEKIKGSKTTPETLHYQTSNRTVEVAPNQASFSPQEAIYNPMSLYVRSKLVPREVVAVNYGVEASSPLVQYIRTDAICDKELTKWTAKNVADFIASTDCADKAELFVEQEIDGKALLSLSPEMLMKGMNLKLGPSVKLYNHIVNLRTAHLL
ncbi:polyhomeotic-proximal chromatin protein-like isoform X2 [Acropora muricata]|uniref:polyhomeotic-proximal chromatin protein-like isoform X2 n=1 Tax=Acropora muricata TaxID=159855 RepID=UPI0034E52258